MRETWDNLWVCEDCWEPKHPQLSIKAVPDDQRVLVARPQRSSAIGSTTTSAAATDYSQRIALTDTSTLRSGDAIGITLDNGEIQWVYVTEMLFNGASYIDYGDSLQTTMQSAFAVSMYFWSNDGQPATSKMLCGSRNNDATDVFYIYQNTDLSGQLSVVYKANDNRALLKTGSILSNGRTSKRHLIVSVSTDYIRLYLDNVLQSDDGTYTGSMSAVTMSEFETDKNFYVGAANYSTSGDSYHFDGGIDNFQVHTSAISSLSIYGYSTVIGLSERLRDSVASGNTVYLSSSTGVIRAPEVATTDL